MVWTMDCAPYIAEYCPSAVHQSVEALVAPYLQDTRPTQDVNGDGPPVSHYAARLFALL